MAQVCHLRRGTPGCLRGAERNEKLFPTQTDLYYNISKNPTFWPTFTFGRVGPIIKNYGKALLSCIVKTFIVENLSHLNSDLDGVFFKRPGMSGGSE